MSLKMRNIHEVLLERVNLSFVKFPFLPLELRLKIWHCANLHRTVFLRLYEESSRNYSSFQIKATVDTTSSSASFQTSNSPPTLLSVNRESRHEILKSYILVRIHNKPRFYLNPDLDTLYFFESPCHSSNFPSNSTDWLAAIRALELGRNTFPVAIYQDIERLYHPTLVSWSDQESVTLLQPFMVAKLGTEVWNAWPLENAGFGPPPLPREGDGDGQVPEEPSRMRFKEVIDHDTVGQAGFPKAAQKDFWDLLGLTLVGTLK